MRLSFENRLQSATNVIMNSNVQGIHYLMVLMKLLGMSLMIRLLILMSTLMSPHSLLYYRETLLQVAINYQKSQRSVPVLHFFFFFFPKTVETGHINMLHLQMLQLFGGANVRGLSEGKSVDRLVGYTPPFI